jgi:type II secretory pathway pseudopilin PulG
MFSSNDRGYAMAALLVGLSVMSIMLSMALPVWRTVTQREREAELVFRGEQYAQAIELFSRRNGGFPPNLEILEEGRYIRKLYKDPMTSDGEFEPVYLGQPLPGQTPEGGRGGPPASAGFGQAGAPRGAGPIIGVVSTSTAESLRLYNGRGRYSEWAFVAIAATTQAGAPGGAQNPGVPNGSGVGVGVPGRRGGGAGGRGGRGGAPPGVGRGFPGQGRGQTPSGGGAQPGFLSPGR